MNTESTHNEVTNFRYNSSTYLPTRNLKSEPSKSCSWVKMNPIDWIDDLNSKAEASEALKPEGKQWSPIPNKDFSSSSLSSSKTSTCDKFVVAGCRSGISMTSSSFETIPPMVEKHIAMIDAEAMPKWWDFGLLQRSESIDQLRLFVLAIEGQPTCMNVKAILEQTRDHFTFSYSKARTLQANESRECLEVLCQDTSRRLQALLVQLIESCEAPPPTCTGDARSSPAQGNKDSFQQHMSNWLRLNWINPYPDEAVSHQLAYETGESIHVVNTWLVNARSRRWRPAILRAFELKRPSEFLLEDSIRMFEEKSVPPIDDNVSLVHTKRMRLD